MRIDILMIKKLKKSIKTCFEWKMNLKYIITNQRAKFNQLINIKAN